MTTLELFRKHRKGEVSREKFLYEVRRDSNLPWVTNTTSYDDAVKILKNKGVIREAQFAPENIQTTPEVDRVNPYFLKKGIEKMLEKEPTLTNDSYINALNKAGKQLARDPHAFDNDLIANADDIHQKDEKLKTKEVKKNNLVDKDNGMKKMKGQQTLKATSAPTKENKKTKKPKGVEIMPDKGVEGKEKIIKESAILELTNYLKKKLNLSENSPYHDHSIGQTVPTPHGQGVIMQINGGTLSIDVDGKLYDVQMNVVQKLKEKEKEETLKPKEEAKVNENKSFDTLEDAKAYAKKQSLEGYVQHVQDKDGHFTVDDWYDSDETVASYENGKLLESQAQEETGAKQEYESGLDVNEAIGTDSIVDYLEEAQENLRDAVDNLRRAAGQLRQSGDSRTAERIRTYIIGHIEPLIDNDHDWLTNDESVQDIIDSLGEEDLDEAIDINDPALSAARARIEKHRTKPKQSLAQLIAKQDEDFEIAQEIKALKRERFQLMRDMEQEAEPEGGPIADDYGDRLNILDQQIADLEAKLYGKEDEVDEAKTAFITGQGGDTTTISYNSDSELKKVAANSDIKGVKTASGQKVKG